MYQNNQNNQNNQYDPYRNFQNNYNPQNPNQPNDNPYGTLYPIQLSPTHSTEAPSATTPGNPTKSKKVSTMAVSPTFKRQLAMASSAKSTAWCSSNCSSLLV